MWYLEATAYDDGELPEKAAKDVALVGGGGAGRNRALPEALVSPHLQER